jgi:hypothetical protein
MPNPDDGSGCGAACRAPYRLDRRPVVCGPTAIIFLWPRPGMALVAAQMAPYATPSGKLSMASAIHLNHLLC